MKIRVCTKNIIALLITFLLLSNAVYAHGMFIKLVEPGVLQVEYDGGGFSPRTEVVLYNSEGNEIERGSVDDEGKYYFDESLDVHKAVADDGMGHRAEYKEGAEQTTIPKLPVIIVVFAVIGVIFVVYNKRTKTKEA